MIEYSKSIGIAMVAIAIQKPSEYPMAINSANVLLLSLVS